MEAIILIKQATANTCWQHVLDNSHGQWKEKWAVKNEDSPGNSHKNSVLFLLVASLVRMTF